MIKPIILILSVLLVTFLLLIVPLLPPVMRWRTTQNLDTPVSPQASALLEKAMGLESIDGVIIEEAGVVHGKDAILYAKASILADNFSIDEFRKNTSLRRDSIHYFRDGNPSFDWFVMDVHHIDVVVMDADHRLICVGKNIGGKRTFLFAIGTPGLIEIARPLFE